jgi:hypothetical protein
MVLRQEPMKYERLGSNAEACGGHNAFMNESLIFH